MSTLYSFVVPPPAQVPSLEAIGACSVGIGQRDILLRTVFDFCLLFTLLLFLQPHRYDSRLLGLARIRVPLLISRWSQLELDRVNDDYIVDVGSMVLEVHHVIIIINPN